MFTGIVEETGVVRSVTAKGSVTEITIGCSQVLSDLKTGDSVSVSGVCLTAESVLSDAFTASATGETLSRSTLKSIKPQNKVNLERAMAADGRFGGHIVQGHVDTVATIVRDTYEGTTLNRTLSIDPANAKYLVEKGSVTLDGISLTIANTQRNEFSVVLIPETLKRTAFKDKKAGDPVNFEGDILAKYIEKFTQQKESGLSLEKLKENGF